MKTKTHQSKFHYIRRWRWKLLLTRENFTTLEDNDDDENYNSPEMMMKIITHQRKSQIEFHTRDWSCEHDKCRRKTSYYKEKIWWEV